MAGFSRFRRALRFWGQAVGPIKVGDMVFGSGEIGQFRERGVLVARGFLSATDVAEVSKWLDGLEVSDGALAEARYFEECHLTGGCVLSRVEHFLGPANPRISDILVSERAVACLAALLGEPPVLFKEKVNYKLPGSRADKLHQDQAAGWNAYANFFVTMALAIDANRADNAPLTFMTSGRYERALMGPEWEPLTLADPPYVPPEDYAVIEADPGDAIFFDSFVPHGSPPNTSAERRRNVYLTFNRRSAGDLRARYYRDKWAAYPPNSRTAPRSVGTYRV